MFSSVVASTKVFLEKRVLPRLLLMGGSNYFSLSKPSSVRHEVLVTSGSALGKHAAHSGFHLEVFATNRQ